MQRIDNIGGPPPRPQDFFRGGSPAAEDERVRSTIAALEGLADTAGLLSGWTAVLDAPAWQREPGWSHSDLHGENLVAANGRLRAIVDVSGSASVTPHVT